MYDLHSHSTASDGTLTPSELVRRAVDAGISFLGLTDHDTVEGIAEATTAARGTPLQLVAGVEISITWNKQAVHVVGLGIDPANSGLLQGLEKLRKFRNWRAEEIGRRLEKSGIPGGFEAAKGFSNGRLISRTHFARFLVDAGYAPDTRKVFKKFLVPGKPGYVPGEWAPLEEALGWICDAGGQAVVAHPARYTMTRGKLRRFLSEFKQLGGVGMEVVSGSHSRDDVFTMARHAKDLGLLASAGSDYHGPENPWVELGRLQPLPDGVTPVWDGWGIEPGRQIA
ncbi:MAG: PHP domain-containing protein [Gammaproteobacteria bacterium]|nr:PHP domain-containing protein [Gammaproteobacteria bacterium]